MLVWLCLQIKEKTTFFHHLLCRYKIPEGLTAAPDETCSSYFSSKTLTTAVELDKMLSEEASVDAKYLGYQFSASLRHKQTSEILNSGQYKLVLSTAKCHYYSASLNIYDLPPFSAEMIAWLQRFNSAITSHSALPYDLVFKIMDYFGTQVPIKVM